MSETVLLGRGKTIVEIPRSVWQKHVAEAPQHSEERLSFMSDDHHRVRYHIVRELVQQGIPLPAELIGEELGLSLDRTKTILDELERNLFFLVRNAAGAVSWAFPITVEPTPHRLEFDSGHEVFAA